MKKFLLFFLITFVGSFQNSYGINNNPIYKNSHSVGCVDLDETFLDLVSIFGDISLLDEVLGCSELIPVLESGILSAFLPFDIPLDCNTNLTPFGYLDVNLSDVCECSCQKHLTLPNYSFTNHTLIKKINVLGGDGYNNRFQIHIYNDGSVKKQYLIR